MEPSRRRFLAMAGTAPAGALLLAGCGDDAGGVSARVREETANDLQILKFALTLEHLEADFYETVLEERVIDEKPLADLLRLIHDQERAHVEVVTEAIRQLGGTPDRPRTSFDAVIRRGRETVLETAARLENLGAAAYLAQLPAIESDSILASALSIHSVEGRHAAALDRVVGRPVVTSRALADPVSKDAVLRRIRRLVAEEP